MELAFFSCLQMWVLNRVYPPITIAFSFSTSITCEIRSRTPQIEKVKTQGGMCYTFAPILMLQAPIKSHA